MQSLLPLAVYCISLVSLQQLLAVAAEERPDRNRLDHLNNLITRTEDKASMSESQSHIAIPSSAPSKSPNWLFRLLRHQPASGARTASPSLAWARPTKASQIERRPLRARRHAHSGTRGSHHYPHHAQLMRVGCVLGTCQVQNLSHRLYQLIGQSGREDSSPINPRSPHSYG
ncbi:protein ADM2a [Plectropomus leopardus]|uniref:protein ADM2a n=1 Tax=Plectropomus leopardus TaxID=160734 RepID=UPI001C4CC5DB|nr:protein ADM2a [Plectropomus leopardus]